MEKILIVDDEQQILRALERVTRKLPYEIEFCTDPMEVLDRVINGYCMDVIISDYRMPELDGVTLIEAVMKKCPNCIPIIMSGNADMKGLQRAINQVGIFRFIEKPWDNDELVEIVNQAVDHLRKVIVKEHMAQKGMKDSLETGSLADQWLKDE